MNLLVINHLEEGADRRRPQPINQAVAGCPDATVEVEREYKNAQATRCAWVRCDPWRSGVKLVSSETAFFCPVVVSGGGRVMQEVARPPFVSAYTESLSQHGSTDQISGHE